MDHSAFSLCLKDRPTLPMTLQIQFLNQTTSIKCLFHKQQVTL